jgi:hypothetical protein
MMILLSESGTGDELDVELLGMSVRIVGAVGRTSTRPNAYTVKPRLDVATSPHASPGLLGLTLRFIVLSF